MTDQPCSCHESEEGQSPRLQCKCMAAAQNFPRKEREYAASRATESLTPAETFLVNIFKQIHLKSPGPPHQNPLTFKSLLLATSPLLQVLTPYFQLSLSPLALQHPSCCPPLLSKAHPALWLWGHRAPASWTLMRRKVEWNILHTRPGTTPYV